MINKDNESIQITLKKSDFQKLKLINTFFNSKFQIELTKSQVIQRLINEFKIDNLTSKTPTKTETNIKEPAPKSANYNAQLSNQERKEQADKLKAESKRKLAELRTLLNLPIKDLAELLNINFETLRDYLKGRRLPTGTNEQIINSYYEKYGIL